MWAWIFNATLAISALLVCSSISILNFMSSEEDITEEKNDENRLAERTMESAEGYEYTKEDFDVESGHRRRKSNKNDLAF
tara:strand:- start:671 stop:910 length:240 start_codon:yes stop_codon:yes gene_type:complete